MKTIVKILLLVVAVLLAVGGVMVYQKTKVAPPMAMTFKNQYVSAAMCEIEQLDSAKTQKELDYAYASILNRLKIQQENSFLDEKEIDELMKKFASQYVSTYVAYCGEAFLKSVWPEEELQGMMQRIKELRSLRTADGQSVLADDSNEKLNSTESVIRNYYAANSAAAVGGYNGVQSAKQKIGTAKKYASMSPINNCTELVNRLNSVASRLERAHYAYLAGQVEKLRNYQNYSEDQYEGLCDKVEKEFKDYKKNASSTYGRMSNVSALEERAARYYSNASFDSSVETE